MTLEHVGTEIYVFGLLLRCPPTPPPPAQREHPLRRRPSPLAGAPATSPPAVDFQPPISFLELNADALELLELAKEAIQTWHKELQLEFGGWQQRYLTQKRWTTPPGPMPGGHKHLDDVLKKGRRRSLWQGQRLGCNSLAGLILRKTAAEVRSELPKHGPSFWATTHEDATQAQRYCTTAHRLVSKGADLTRIPSGGVPCYL